MTTYKQCIAILSAAIFGFGLAGCGGGGGGGGDNTTAPATTTGVFVDSPVSGLSYSCSSGVDGLTNSSGQFTCNTGDSVTFSLGNYMIGSCLVTIEVTPYSLYPDNAEAAVNVAQLLQTIDDATDGSIAIPFDYSELDAVVTEPTDSSFEADIQAVLGVTLVTEAVALDHMNATLGLPSVTDGFTADWIEGKTLYQVILDSEDDDNDGSTTDWLLVAAKYENGITFLDFSADGTFEVTTETFVIINGVLTITDGADIETETIIAVDDKKITVNWQNNWGEPDGTVFEFFTKADAQAYLDELNAPSLTDGFVADWIEGKTLYQVILDSEDDDNDGSTTDWLLVAAKYENGITLLDFSADGTFEVTTETFVIINGVLTITDGADIETETIIAVDDKKITVNWQNNWGEPDGTVFEFFTKADAEAYMLTLP